MPLTTWAIGAAYATSVEGGAEFRKKNSKAGLNRSDVHVDFMIGSSQMDIDGSEKTAPASQSSAARLGNIGSRTEIGRRSLDFVVLPHSWLDWTKNRKVRVPSNQPLCRNEIGRRSRIKKVR